MGNVSLNLRQRIAEALKLTDAGSTEKQGNAPDSGANIFRIMGNDNVDTFESTESGSSKGSQGALDRGAPLEQTSNLVPIYSYDENGEISTKYVNPDTPDGKNDLDGKEEILDSKNNVIGYASEDDVEEVQADFDEAHNNPPRPEEGAVEDGNTYIGDDDTADKN
jgi:hypothetical protein